MNEVSLLPAAVIVSIILIIFTLVYFYTYDLLFLQSLGLWFSKAPPFVEFVFGNSSSQGRRAEGARSQGWRPEVCRLW